MPIGAGLYFLVDGILRLKRPQEGVEAGSRPSASSRDTQEGSNQSEEVAAHEVVLDEPLNSGALAAFGRLLRYYGVFLVLLVGVGLLSGEPFFRRWAMVEVLMVLSLWPMPPLLIALFLARARKRIQVDKARGLVVVQVVLGDRLLRESQVRVSAIDKIELRRFPSWNLGVPAELKRVLILAHLEDGTTELLAQVAEMEKAERVVSALRVL